MCKHQSIQHCTMKSWWLTKNDCKAIPFYMKHFKFLIDKTTNINWFDHDWSLTCFLSPNIFDDQGDLQAWDWKIQQSKTTLRPPT